MTPAARYAAAIDIFDGFLGGEPIEKLLSNWARKNRYAGSKDRAAVRDIVFDGLRNLRSFQAISGLEGGCGIAVGHCLANDIAIDEVFSGQGYAPAPLTLEEQEAHSDAKVLTPEEQANLPDWLCEIAKADLDAGFNATTKALSDRAPVDLRVNLIKGDVENAVQALAAEDISVEHVPAVPAALRVLHNPRRVAGSKAYSSGLIELQDAASQAVVSALDLHDDMRVLDYCAGGGGKTLAMAGANPNAQFDAWDVSAARLAPMAERAKRAGARVTLLERPPQSNVYDLVLVDAPCSGSGSWRRNPEGKWRLTSERLAELQTLQSTILHKAAQNVKAGGTLAYATCSIFQRENRVQVDAFLAQNPEFELISDKTYDIGAPSDGFYCAILINNFSV